jgi:beta-glucosidase
MKHFALNDQETNRYGLAAFAQEQAVREIFIKGFEMAATEGDAVAMMAAMNRVGARWVGAHKGLMTDIVRNEWGFEGMVITDQASVTAMLYQDIVSGLAGGTDLWLNTNTELWSLKEYESNPTVMNNVRRATHNIIYAVANSNAMNGISADSQVIEITPWWQVALYALASVVWGLSVLVIVKTTLTLNKQKINKK